MAKSTVDINALCNKLVEDAKNGIFKPVYLLMGDEAYYPDLVCNTIIDNCLQDYEKDFNETICYGADVDADAVITAARRFPMMAERQLVVVKDAQQMKSLEDLSIYCANPLDSTVLVILMRGASADKRKSLYKTVQKTGVVVDSPAIRDYEMQRWIVNYMSSRGLSIAQDAALLFAESAGTDLSRIVVETDKMLKNLPEGTTSITLTDIEKNVGVSRQFSVFELTKALSEHNAAKALRIATYIGTAPRFAMPMATSTLFSHFNRILKYEAFLRNNPRAANDEKARILGISPFFLREYDLAVANYPIKKSIMAISLITQYDFKGKGGEAGEASQAEMLTELVAKLLAL